MPNRKIGDAKSQSSRDSKRTRGLLRISRREFLTGAGATVLSGGPAFAAGDPQFTQIADGYRVDFNGLSWSVTSRLFVGKGGRPKVVLIESAYWTTLSLSRALYPGSTLSAGFDADFYPRASEWFVRLRFALTGRSIEMPLADWMASVAPAPAGESFRAHASFHTAEIADGRIFLESARGAIDVEIRADFSATLSSIHGISCSVRPGGSFGGRGKFKVTTTRIDFKLLPAASPIATQFDLTGIDADDTTIDVGTVGSQLQARARFYKPNVTFVSVAPRDAGAQITIASTDAEISLGAENLIASDIALEDAKVELDTRQPDNGIHVFGVVASKPHGLQTETFSLQVEGDGSQVVDKVFHKKHLDEFRVGAMIVGASIPSSDGTVANVLSPPSPLTIVFGDDIGDSLTATLSRQCDAICWIGASGAKLLLPLEKARLRLRRGYDLFDLSFGFLHYAAVVDSAVTKLYQRWAFPEGCSPPGTGDRTSPRIIVHFPPQHLIEQTFQEPDSNPPIKIPTAGNSNLDPDQTHSHQNPTWPRIEQKDLASSRASGPSRLVFEDKTWSPGDIRGERLTVEYLTDWYDLALAVNKRALPREVTLEDQLSNAGIDVSMSRPNARAKVTAQVQPPLEDETAIEPIFRLIISPDSGAQWSTRRRAPDFKSAAEMWTTRLVNSNDTAVRALYARQMDLGFLAGQQHGSSPDLTGFEASMSDDDRRQIVGLTSIYGLAALRRLMKTQPTTSKDPTFIDDPNGMVFLPQRDYAYLDHGVVKPEQGGAALLQEGVVLAKPFERFDLTLSRSATVNALWKGEPPAGLGNNPFFSPAFTIEKYAHRIRDGRDAFVEITYKGFLFPYGHRAALLKLSRREIHPYKNNTDQTRPISYLVQHFFIVCHNPDKTFRAYNQPFTSYDFSPSLVSMKTVQTPDLALPEWPGPLKSIPDPSDLDRPTPANVFWPTLLKPDAVNQPGPEVSFVHTIDGDDNAPARAPLLFVDNAAAHAPEVMEKVVSYYNGLTGADERFRTVQHGGASRRYAVESKQGDCTYETLTWRLSARGRIVTKKDNGNASALKQDFTMDAYMEGQDQPPFYPWMEQATVSIQSVNRLIGRQNQTVDVGFVPRYVLYGFDPSKNPSEVFLEVRQPPIYLDASDDSRSTGGVAKPTALLKAISRSNGAVGGSSITQEQAQIIASTRVSISTSAPVPVEPTTPTAIDSALSGKFNPLEFFGGAIKDAKLLGIIPLKDLLKVALMQLAPKLVEQTGFSTKEIDDEAAKLAGALGRSTDAVVANVRATRAALDDKLYSSLGVKLNDLYPRLAHALDDVVGEATRVKNDLSGLLDLGVLITDAGKLMEAVNVTLAELAAIGRNPMPANVKEAIGKIQASWDTIRNVFKHPADKIARLVRNFLTDARDGIYDKICDAAISSGVFESVFGPLESDGGYLYPDDPLAPPASNSASREEIEQACRALLRNPADVPPRFKEALFHEVIGGAFLEALTALKQIDAFVGGNRQKLISWSRRQLADQMVPLLRQNIPDAEHPDAPKVAYTIANIAADALIDIVIDTSEQTVAGHIEAARDKIQAQVDGFLAEIAGEIQNAKTRLANAQAEADAALIAAEIEAYHVALGTIEIVRSKRDAWIAVISAYTTIPEEDLKKIFENLGHPTFNVVKAPLDGFVKAITDRVNAQIRSAQAEAKRAVDAFVKASINEISSRITKTLESLMDQALSAAETVNIATIAKDVAGWCDTAKSDFVDLALNLITRATATLTVTQPKLTAIDATLRALASKIASLSLPDGPAETARRSLAATVGALATSSHKLIESLSAFERLRADADTRIGGLKNSQACQDVEHFIQDLDRALRSRIKIADIVATMMASAGDAVEISLAISSTKSIAPAADAQGISKDCADLYRQLLEFCHDVTSFGKLADASWQLVISGAVPSEIMKTQVSETWGALTTEAKALENAYTKVLVDLANTPKEAHATAITIATRIRTYSTEFERKFAGQILQAALANSALITALEGALTTGLDPVLTMFKTVTDQAAGIVNDFVVRLRGDWGVLLSILSSDVVQKFTDIGAALNQDSADLNGILATTDVRARTQALFPVLMRWRGSNGPAIKTAVETVEGIVTAILTGHLSTLFNPKALEKALKDAVVEILPVHASLSYDFHAALPSFPSSSPVFMMDPDSIYLDAKVLEDDLVLSTKIEINLLTGQRTVTGTGDMRPFKIHLLGSSLDLVTLNFKGANFSIAPGKSSDFRAEIGGFETGSALQFLSALNSIGTTGGNKDDKENGLYYEYRVFPPEVEVGYRYNKPFLQVGTLQFQNIGLAISAHLPLDYRFAEFRFSFATRDKPFLISQPPYGGGGFVGLRSTASGFLAFEIQLEFGAMVAIQFGPLQGSGRVTAGIYLLSYSGGTRRLEGFVHAVGEGHVACFGASFLLEVRTIQNGSSMEGSSTYSFEFHVGTFSVSYSVTASYHTVGGDGSQSSSSGTLFLSDRLDQAGGDELAEAAIEGGLGKKSPARASGPVIRNRMPSKRANWAAYAKHFKIA